MRLRAGTDHRILVRWRGEDTVLGNCEWLHRGSSIHLSRIIHPLSDQMASKLFAAVPVTPGLIADFFPAKVVSSGADTHCPFGSDDVEWPCVPSLTKGKKRKLAALSPIETWNAFAYGSIGSAMASVVPCDVVKTAVEMPREIAEPSLKMVLKMPPASACWCDGKDCITYIYELSALSRTDRVCATHICNVELKVCSNDRQDQRRKDKCPIQAVGLHQRVQNVGGDVADGAYGDQKRVVDPVQHRAGDDVVDQPRNRLGDQMDGHPERGQLLELLHEEGQPEVG